MLRNYFKIAWRSLSRNTFSSAINVLGLAIGIAVCLVIVLFVQDELSYDRFHEKADRIVRIVFKADINGGQINEAVVMPPTAQTLKNDFAEVQEATRLRTMGMPRVMAGGRFFTDDKMAYVDSNFFRVFTIPFLQGDSKTALVQPNCLVISQKLALKYFGKANPLGKLLHFKKGSGAPAFRITGVFGEIPANSHFHFDMFGSMASDTEAGSTSWMVSNYFTYLVLPEAYDYKRLEAKLPRMVEKYMGPQVLQALGMSLAQFRTKGNKLGFRLQKLTDIHFNSDNSNELEAGGDITHVYIFGVIAVFMLLIACINFMNLSTARSSKRAKEVGVRKVLGSLRHQLMIQFFAECVLLSFLALIVALGVVSVLLPFFNDIADKTLSISRLFSLNFVITLAILPVLVGVLAGSYPAIFLSSFEPIQVLKGRLSLKGGSLRNGLVVFQFAISIVLIISTFIVYRQINFIQQKNLGYNKEQILIINDAYALDKQAVAFKEEILKLKGVVNGTLSSFLPTPSNRDNTVMFPEGQIDQTRGVSIGRWDIDYDYVQTLGMSIIKGRNFSKQYGTDSTGVILNETAVKLFGFKDPLNKGITLFMNDDKKVYRVVGVVKDFHFETLKSNIGALCMMLNQNRGNVSFRLDAGSDIPNTIKQMEAKWNAMAPGQPFSYSFMDDSFNNVYKAEQRIGKLSLAFAFLTILVACLGLFGLVTFITEQRIKEIGIRKILGATVGSVVLLLSKDFLKLVLISIVISSPVAYYAMDKWLADFAYRINIEWWIFVIAGFCALLIALLTVSYQAIKAALMNPVKSLKTE